MNKETVIVSREDLEYLKKCFEHLQKENDELKAKLDEAIDSQNNVEPIGLDLSGFEMFFKKEEQPIETEEKFSYDIEEVDDLDEDEIEALTEDIPNLSDIVVNRK